MKNKRKPWNKLNLIGNRYDMLLVVAYGKNKDNHDYWKCLCDCGRYNYVRTAKLRSKKNPTRSCGCLRNKHAYNWKGVGEISSCYFRSVINNANARKLKFDITLEELWNLFLKQNRKCALTDIELTFTSNYRDMKKFQTASIDRIDSSKGYTIDNIQWVHKYVNVIKRDVPQDQFIDFCKKVAKKFP